MWPTISALKALAEHRIGEYCNWSKHQTLSKLHTSGTALCMHVFTLAHLLIHLLYIPSCTNWVTLMLFLTMHALRGAYQATLLAFITMSMATTHGICYFQMWSTYWFILSKKKHEWILAGTCVMWMQTVMLAATIELPYGRRMLPNVGVSRLLDLACVPWEHSIICTW